MKKIIYISLAVTFISWNLLSIDNDSRITKQESRTEQVRNYIQKKQDTLSENFINTQNFYKKENSLILDYKYPHLDEAYSPLFRSFNSFIENTYLITENSIAKVLHNDDLSCDPLFKDAERKRRNIDYKIYTKNEHFLSVLLYKTNYYDEEHHNSFMFKGLNYDLKTGDFIVYDDLFENNSDKFLLFKLNQELQARIGGQDSFNDCWEFTKDTFQLYKNNFVINSEHIKFYFDDCTVCPTYAGNYFLEIPLEELAPILKTKKLQTSYFKT